MTCSPADDRILHTYHDAPWLPPGGHADVVAAARRGRPPEPTCIVRVLAMRDGRIYSVPRGAGDGLDIPSRPVDSEDPERCVRSLLTEHFGRPHPTTVLGYVRNTVSGPAVGYRWPVPYAHFTVFHCRVDSAFSGTPGMWLDPEEAAARLGERHWWPLHQLVSP